jgi:hypothetical protein
MGTFPAGYLDFLLEAVGEEIEAEFGFPPGQCMDETLLKLPSPSNRESTTTLSSLLWRARIVVRTASQHSARLDSCLARNDIP